MSEKIKLQHLQRKAILYIRQSSTYQVHNNLESQKLQYAMQERLRQLGWCEIEVVDEDLGRSAAGTVARSGFERMVAEVCLGKVGAVAAREVSRFARNSREWQQLVEVCRVVDTLLIDHETVYAPRQGNDRLLLGLKGNLNEYELDLLRQRSVEARYAKARRGELLVASPVGYEKGDNDHLEKHPDRRLQEAVLLVFNKFTEIGSVRQTLMWFLENGLQLPTQTRSGEVCWKRPVYSILYNMLTNPAYGGAYAYGRSEQIVRYDDGEQRKATRRKPREGWLVLLPNAHEGYVSWEQFEQIQRAIAENNHGWQRVGAAHNGAALLAGLLRCRRCGRKLVVSYSGKRGSVLRYICQRGALDNGEPRCIGFGGGPVDAVITREVLRIVQPAALEAAVMASEEIARKRDEVLAALQRDLEAARYSASRAQRQYDAADPENRLIAAELERRWDQALQRVQTIENQIALHKRGQGVVVTPTREELEQLASKLQMVWESPEVEIRLKKRIVRTLIEEIVVDVDSAAGEVIVVIHWSGGVHTEVRLPRRRRGQNSSQASKEIIDTVRDLSLICSDKIIAAFLNRNGLLTGRGNRWTRDHVTALRSYHQIPCHSADAQAAEGWMNLTQAAHVLNINPRTLRIAVERGQIEARHPLPDGPWVINRRALQTSAAADLVQRGNRTVAIPNDEQETFDFAST
jgi:DNA invertase Pin-like site-specific DNA recombinase